VTPARRTDSRVRALTLTRDVGSAFGGAERLAFEYAMRLDPARFKRYLCVTHAPDPQYRAATERDVARLRVDGVEVLRMERRSLASNIAWARLYALLVRESIDIAHAHMPRASVPGTVIARAARVPVIVSHEHGWSFEGKPLRRFLDRHIVARGSDVLLAVSEWDRRNIAAVERVPLDRVRVLSNGVRLTPAEGHDLRAELGIPAEVGLVGAVGMLRPEKGYRDLIHAVAQLKRDSVAVRCVIAGDGPEEGALRSLIAGLGLTDDVLLLGRRTDVTDVIASLDVAVLASKHEGSPLAVIEYMAGAVPIVATAVGGVPELVHDGVHGLLVRPGDPAALAGAIGRLLGDRTLARGLAHAAHERQRANFDLDVVVQQLEKIYIELYERATSRTPARGSAAGR
jgi:glycosyltransferase involved in cell wall biosynthesis